jgi:hypothetical protein
MQSDSGGRSAPHAEREAVLIVLAAVTLIPFLVIGHGYLPGDDALRHVAKVVSGKTWQQILVMRPDMTMDSHPGWHAILGAVHRAFGWSAPALIFFSVITTFLAVSLAPALLLRRPEAWLLSLVALGATEPAVLARIFSGRPFGITMALLAVVCLAWHQLQSQRVPHAAMALLATLVALDVWIHPSWYLWALPVAAFLAAREWRVASRLIVCLSAGVLFGAALSGQPLALLMEPLMHGYLALGSSPPESTLALEFRPRLGSVTLLLFAAVLLGWRALRGSRRTELARDPVFLLALGGWVLGFVAARFWSDWGAVALLVWASLELQAALDELAPRRRQRLTAAALAALVALITLTANIEGRWGSGLDPALAGVGRPERAHLLPRAGGILYSDDMRLFFDLFYRMPEAPWRYVVGYEPGLMLPEDLEVYRQAHVRRTTEGFAPWVQKMLPSDRLILRSLGSPGIAGLEWGELAPGLWSGRLPHS